ncbi:MAG TPA: polysaccharide deacetylase family protein [Clostridia bacterium]|nr:polysaccharide deacetylase family protein [Clostridia bacterium]
MISLDLELAWGVRDIYSIHDPYMVRVIHERRVVPRILELFEKYRIGATWAAVGIIFARSRRELEDFSPSIKPQYNNPRLNPYRERIGGGEGDDPLHFGHSLIKEIQKARRQEIATHTFSHYYCLEEGQNRDTFAADLDSALALAAKNGIQIKSIVFPRNQRNPDYDEVLLDRGIICFRGTERHPMYQAGSRENSRLPHKRIYRLLDSHISLSGSHLTSWGDVVEESGLYNIPASRYLRPVENFSFFAGLRLKRTVNAMEEAARSKRIFHLWTHPQDFGGAPEENLCHLETILQHFKRLEEEYGMVSLSMREAALQTAGVNKKEGESWKFNSRI